MVHARLKRLREYRWSSYRACLGKSPRPSWLIWDCVLSFFPGPSPDCARSLSNPKPFCDIRDVTPFLSLFLPFLFY
jgi:hypothetical protein